MHKDPNMRLYPFALLLAPLAVSAADLHADARNLQPLDVFALEWADNPAMSPDGAQIVYQRNHYDIMKDRRRSHLWLVDADGERHRPLTTGQGSDGAPAWAPDGDRIAWTSAREGSSQIWVRWMDTGQSAVLSQLPQSPGNLAWSPDGKWLAFTMRVPAKPKPLATMPAKPKGAEWAGDVKVIDSLNYRFDGAGYVDPGFSHVFVLPAEGGTPRQITQGDFQHRATPVWSTDGRSLFVVSNHAADWEYAPQESEIYRVDVETGRATALTDRDGPDGSPALSPDGRRLAYVGFDDRKLGYQSSLLYVMDLDGGTPRVLTADFDYQVDSPAWDRNGRGIYFSFEREGRGHIGWVSASGGAVETVVDDFDGTAMGRPYGGGAFSVASGRVAYTRGTIDRPADVAVAQRGGDARVLTDLNSDALAHKRLGEVEELWVKSSADGLDVQGWIVKPPNFDASKKYPLMLEIHGGPFANYGPRFAPETQLYASAGYVVLYVNPRGSTSYGHDFANQIHHNYPSKDYDDLITSVDAVIAKGYVDPQQLYVTGGSGGGVLTAWIVGHTDRFRAAVVAKPVINWTSFVLTADAYQFFVDYWFGKMPWDDGAQAEYWKRSPLAYVGNVKTPTMLLTGEDDYRTPISETEQFYQALKLRRVETAMVRIPGASHGINARPSQMIAQVLNTLAWFERYRTVD
jgi:dipeptidyl aminopeptidase/acylaminoacyl peptidase